jgi:hypothetical protein
MKMPAEKAASKLNDNGFRAMGKSPDVASLEAQDDEPVQKFNVNHDPHTGEFAGKDTASGEEVRKHLTTEKIGKAPSGKGMYQINHKGQVIGRVSDWSLDNNPKWVGEYHANGDVKTLTVPTDDVWDKDSQIAFRGTMEEAVRDVADLHARHINQDRSNANSPVHFEHGPDPTPVSSLPWYLSKGKPVDANQGLGQKGDVMISSATKLDRSTRARKAPLPGNELQSNPANTDTMQEDPSVDSLKTPVPYADVMRMRHPSLRIKSPTGFSDPTQFAGR